MLTTQSNAIACGQNKSKFNLCGKTGVFLAVALSASLLTACGGGSSSTTTIPTTTPDTTAPPSTVTPPPATTPAARTFSKLNLTGEAYVENGLQTLGCLKDSNGNKFWEVKSNAAATPDFRDKDYGYFWHDGTVGVTGMTAGTAVTANLLSSFPCQASGSLTKCDTGSYIKAVNAARLCGKTNWRLPTKDELLSLIDTTRTAAPFVYNDFVGSTSSDAETAGQLIRGYWSSTPSPTAAATNRLAVSFSKKDDARVQDHAMGNVLNNYVRLIAD